MAESNKSLNQIIKFRLDKLNKVYDHGVDPYPQKFEPKHKGATLIINPPYGERIGEENSINDLYERVNQVAGGMSLVVQKIEHIEKNMGVSLFYTS